MPRSFRTHAYICKHVIIANEPQLRLNSREVFILKWLIRIQLHVVSTITLPLGTFTNQGSVLICLEDCVSIQFMARGLEKSPVGECQGFTGVRKCPWWGISIYLSNIYIYNIERERDSPTIKGLITCVYIYTRVYCCISPTLNTLNL